MPDPNNMNPKKGRDFQNLAARILSDYFNVAFLTEQAIPIGNPPKLHKFDLVSIDKKYIGESKNYSYTEGGNIPSAKMMGLNEAVFYLQHLPTEKDRFIVVRKEVGINHSVTLGEHYYKTNRHLLNSVFIIEIDVKTNEVREIGR
jgi:hypothetical protein